MQIFTDVVGDHVEVYRACRTCVGLCVVIDPLCSCREAAAELDSTTARAIARAILDACEEIELDENLYQ